MENTKSMFDNFKNKEVVNTLAIKGGDGGTTPPPPIIITDDTVGRG